ncbi:MAG TPA: 2-oxoglutarate dehydrogenase E1 component, partial [Trueperaceae bacterium]|nr:2-oxoglutarate dehydrogenase E1 component [Trueperaceae bacterium]
VVNGRVRAKQDRINDKERQKVLSIAIHGDAAFIGEGVVQETLNLSELEAYRISGTLHVVLNNQIGFTTTPEQSRSSFYATDIAKMLQSPIFHVNGEDPEAVAQVVKLAMDFRHKFKRDVVIDVYGYRKFGHNESDEPAFTQPLMYDVIRKRKSVRQGYLDHLLTQSDISREEADEIKAAKIAELELELESARAKDYKISYQAYEGEWTGYKGGDDADCKEVKTAVSAKRLKELLLKLSQTPEGFRPNSKIRRLLDAKAKMAAGKTALDWSAAEALAFATISTDGYRIRMTGQDAERGTFSHRHAVLHDRNTDKRYMPLAHLSPNQAEIEIKNSALSETAVLGFEFGYSLDWPDGLTIWEAQFGDFANAGQVIIDQFISSTEDKWRRLSGLVMLLPHGFEGQGPEHSSARLERFLVLAAEDNMQIMNLTTPAQIFHALRRQILRKWRKPLVIMSPKSLLRHPRAVSDLKELSQGKFQKLIPDPVIEPKKAKRILMVSGKLYYELLAKQEEDKVKDIALIRLEQIYPLPKKEIRAELNKFAKDIPVIWVQEEPENMGAWYFLRAQWCAKLAGHNFSGIYREASASPATGSGSSHKIEQAKIINDAFNLKKTPKPCV